MRMQRVGEGGVWVCGREEMGGGKLIVYVSLLGSAGFSLTAVDVDTVTIMFPDAMSLLYALQVEEEEEEEE